LKITQSYTLASGVYPSIVSQRVLQFIDISARVLINRGRTGVEGLESLLGIRAPGEPSDIGLRVGLPKDVSEPLLRDCEKYDVLGTTSIASHWGCIRQAVAVSGPSSVIFVRSLAPSFGSGPRTASINSL